MEIQHKEETGKGIFFIEKEASRIAELIYLLPDNSTMVIDHTEVSEELRGQRIGKKLVEAAVGHARSNGLKIVADCPYAKTVIQRNESYRELLK